ncbi:MAG: DUF6526 family protein [Gemmatimonadota bacterium]
MARNAVPQTYANHRRVVVGYHIVTFFILFINLIWSVVQAFRHVSVGAVVTVLLAVALFLLFFYARVFALAVQDRVIRLEMRLRLQQVLPADLQGRIGEITRGQFVALRFASDAELPALVRKVLDAHITDKKQIKLMIKEWVPDYLRA